MAGIQDFITWHDDFLGNVVIGTTGDAGSPWVITDTSAAGTPTYGPVTPSNGGEFAMTLAATAEAENLSLTFNDLLCFDIDKIDQIEFRLKTSATLDSTTDLAFGLCGNRNDSLDTLAQNAHFRLDGSNAVVVETDDGTTDNNDVATGQTLGDEHKRFVISFAGGTDDVKFYIDGNRVAGNTTFDMSSYTGSLQPYVQLQKTSDDNTDSVTIDYVRVVCRR